MGKYKHYLLIEEYIPSSVRKYILHFHQFIGENILPPSHNIPPFLCERVCYIISEYVRTSFSWVYPALFLKKYIMVYFLWGCTILSFVREYIPQDFWWSMYFILHESTYIVQYFILTKPLGFYMRLYIPQDFNKAHGFVHTSFWFSRVCSALSKYTSFIWKTLPLEKDDHKILSIKPRTKLYTSLEVV